MTSFAPRAREDRNLTQDKVEFPNLMRAGHGDVERPSSQLQIPRRIQRRGARHSDFRLARLPSGSRDGRNYLRFQIDCANQMVLRIGNVKCVAVKCHSLRSKESCSIKGPIICSVRSRADGFKQSSVQLRAYDAIVIRVGNEKAIALRVGQDLAGKSQRQIANLRAFQHKF